MKPKKKETKEKFESSIFSCSFFLKAKFEINKITNLYFVTSL